MKYEISTPLAVHEIGQREKQEDSIFPLIGDATEADRLFILCDGIGGHQSGEIASQTVCRVISDHIKAHADSTVPFKDQMLYEAINKAYDALDQKDITTSEKKMGTTLVFLYFHAGGLMAAHLGDSRYYHIRPKTKEIIYRSEDHSLATLSFKTGEVGLEEMDTMEGHNVILRAMMPHQEARDMPDIVHIKDIKPGDWFFMCSDGMLEQMTDDELLNVVCNKDLSNEQKRDWLITSTSANKDNHSAYLIRIDGVMSDLTDENEPDDEAEARLRNTVFMAELEKGKEREHAVEVIASDIENTPDVTPQIEVSSKQKDSQPSSQPQSYASSGSNTIWRWVSIVAIVLAASALAYIFFHKEKTHEPKQKTIIIHYDDNDASRNSNDNDIAPVGTKQQSTVPQTVEKEEPLPEKVNKSTKIRETPKANKKATTSIEQVRKNQDDKETQQSDRSGFKFEVPSKQPEQKQKDIKGKVKENKEEPKNEETPKKADKVINEQTI